MRGSTDGHLVRGYLPHFIGIMGIVVAFRAIFGKPAVVVAALVVIHPGIEGGPDLVAVVCAVNLKIDQCRTHTGNDCGPFIARRGHQSLCAGQNLGLLSVDRLRIQRPLIPRVGRHPSHRVGVERDTLRIAGQLETEPHISLLIGLLIAVHCCLIGYLIGHLIE